MKKETEEKKNTFEFSKGNTFPIPEDLIYTLKNSDKVLNIGNLKGMILETYDGKPSFLKTMGDARGLKAKVFNAFFCRLSDINKYTHFLVHEDDYSYYLDFMASYAEDFGNSVVHRIRNNTIYKVSFIPPILIQQNDDSSSVNIYNDYISDITTLNSLKECSEEQDEQIKKMLKKWVCFCLTYEDDKCTNVYTDSGNMVVISYSDNKMFTNVITQTKTNKITGEKVVKEISDFKDNVPKMFAARSKGAFKKNMKYDMILMNPPYDGNLHLKILSQTIDKLLDENGTCVNLSPIRWLQDPLAEYKKSEIKAFNDVKIHIKEMFPIKAENAVELFNVLFPQDIGIYVLNKKEHNVCFVKESIRNFVKKIYNYEKHWSDVSEENKIDGIRVKCQKLRNSGPSSTQKVLKSYKKPKDSFDLMYRTYSCVFIDGAQDGKWWTEFGNKNKYTKPTGTPLIDSIKFDTIEEAKNFEESCKTTFMKYCNFISKVGVHTDFNFLPFMSNYTEPWTNERFCKYFNITGFMSDTEAEKGSEWEEILETMEPYI